MKKRILTMLLAALLVANISACNYVQENDIEVQNERTIDLSKKINGKENEKAIDLQKSNTNISNVDDNQKDMTEQNKHSQKNTYTDDTLLDKPIYSSYVGDSAYLQKENDLFLTEVDGQPHLYIPKWEKNYSVSEDYPNNYKKLCGTVREKTAWIFKYDHEQTEATNGNSFVFTMLKIHRETGIQEETTISFPVSAYENFANVFCNMLDDHTGFLFIYGFKDSKIHLESLSKTTDGGKTWTTLGCDESGISRDCRDCIIVSHFFDENNGMIVPRTASGANSNVVYITLDGGKTWNWAKIPYNDYDPELIGADNRYLQLKDFEYKNGQYILTFRLHVGWGEGTDNELVSFTSTELKDWTYLT